MKVFMSAEGKYLRFWRAEKGGFVAGSEWRYEWVSIHDATLALFIPCGRADKWAGGHNPAKLIVAELGAEVVVTRVVTLVKEEGHE
jgi:hypothetical protein